MRLFFFLRERVVRLRAVEPETVAGLFIFIKLDSIMLAQMEEG